MGLAGKIIDVISVYLPVESVCELGSQQMFATELNGKFASEWYKSKGVKNYTCIDLNRKNNALDIDLSIVITDYFMSYDIVTDIGTSEHVTNLQNCWANKVLLCKKGGLIISENPKAGSWQDHGFHYMTIDKVKEIGKELGLTLVDIGEVAAMENTKDGWNIWSVFRK